jgi:hypothetical protein
MKKRIQEAVTFIQRTREEAITLANDVVGDAEVHALVITKGFVPAPEPVGYMVVTPKEWVGLTDEEVNEFYWISASTLEAIEAKLKEKNHAG